eukprot:CAMPEP_0179115418 /NCGR_PEP_ID=MMETSP0796-20121207/54088_1 /TAXON_ID=73915 /ORGANISM="Pyrodinium bahamense, Strain pbaha01" /LENGTH=973 /DNA_ID=CAMNT_0020813665 /DNA_START=21 /DNA_END=2939 /DNA_ORIENTATION=+
MGVSALVSARAPEVAGCSCWEALHRFRGNELHPQRREDFERTVSFLASVPLFRTQLPRSELPKVAQSLTQRMWKPGQKLVRQGDIGGASVVTSCPGEPEQVCATLYPGDYFGGHTLMSERPNVATIVAKGPSPLVTLSMSRTSFEDSGLKLRLHFPKRPAVCEDTWQSETDADSAAKPPLPGEVDFIQKAILRNGNLRALAQQASDDTLRGIAAAAERREVPKGTVVGRAGEVGHELIVVREGFFTAFTKDLPNIGGPQSAEAAVAHSTMARRILRKQSIINELFRTNSPCTSTSARRSASHGSRLDCSSGLRRRRSTGERGGETVKERQQVEPLLRSPPASRRACRQPKQGGQQANWEVPAVDARGATHELQRTVSERIDRAVAPGELDPSDACVTFGIGESFGELSLMYNVQHEGTFVASEDSVVYAIKRRHFTAWFRGKRQRFVEYSKFLGEVYALSQLLSSERWELACNATGLVEFRPGERVLHQGKVRYACKWYIIYSGSCTMTQTHYLADGQSRTTKLAELFRAGHFGERSLLRGDAASQVNVDAGPEGMCCLTFDGETIRPILESIFHEGNNLVPSPTCNIEEWCQGKAWGWDRQTSPRRRCSQGGSQTARHLELHSLVQVCELGRGGFGQVILVEDPTTERCYALKKVSKGHVQKKHSERQISWERELLSMLESPFIVSLHKTFRDEQHVYFLLEAALGGNLLEVLHMNPEVLTEDEPHGYGAAFYAACLTSALEHMHERRIVHRDVKPENVLLDARGYAKLGDMGFARFVLGKTNTRVGTPDYMAPEVIDFPHTHDMAVDWWSLGVLAYEILSGQTPWEDEGICEPMERLLAIRQSQEQARLAFPFRFPHSVKDFVSRLLQRLPHRLGATGGATAVRKHKMFASLGVDFRALHAHVLPSPFLPEEWKPAKAAAAELGLGRNDSIFELYEDSDNGWDGTSDSFRAKLSLEGPHVVLQTLACFHLP